MACVHPPLCVSTACGPRMTWAEWEDGGMRTCDSRDGTPRGARACYGTPRAHAGGTPRTIHPLRVSRQRRTSGMRAKASPRASPVAAAAPTTLAPHAALHPAPACTEPLPAAAAAITAATTTAHPSVSPTAFAPSYSPAARRDMVSPASTPTLAATPALGWAPHMPYARFLHAAHAYMLHYLCAPAVGWRHTRRIAHVCALAGGDTLIFVLQAGTEDTLRMRVPHVAMEWDRATTVLRFTRWSGVSVHTADIPRALVLGTSAGAEACAYACDPAAPPPMLGLVMATLLLEVLGGVARMERLRAPVHMPQSWPSPTATPTATAAPASALVFKADGGAALAAAIARAQDDGWPSAAERETALGRMRAPYFRVYVASPAAAADVTLALAPPEPAPPASRSDNT